jgi:hypothetical protein
MEDVSPNSGSSETSAVKDLCRRSRSLEVQDTIDASAEFFVSDFDLRDKDQKASVVLIRAYLPRCLSSR